MNASIKIKTKSDDGRPMYRGIEEHFADLIVRHELTPGDKLPSINKVASAAGINSRTVMQAYQCLVGRGMVEVRNGMGTFVADTQECRRITAIGLAGWSYEDMHSMNGNHYAQAIYTGIHEEATKRNIDCRGISMTTDMVKECRDKEISGCIVMGTEPSAHFLLSSLERGRLKAVTISGSDNQSIPIVHGDDSQGMHLLIDHLFSLGHSRIALFYGNPGNYSAQRRLAVYQHKMSQANLNIHPSWLCNDSRFSETPNELEHLLSAWFRGGDYPAPTAIIAAGEHSALATLQMLNSKNICIPKDVSVCGYDDFPGIQEFATPALTVIRQPVAEIGRTAVRNLIALLGDEQVEHAVLPVELIVRASTAEAVKSDKITVGN